MVSEKEVQYKWYGAREIRVYDILPLSFPYIYLLHGFRERSSV